MVRDKARNMVASREIHTFNNGKDGASYTTSQKASFFRQIVKT